MNNGKDYNKIAKNIVDEYHKMLNENEIISDSLDMGVLTNVYITFKYLKNMTKNLKLDGNIFTFELDGNKYKIYHEPNINKLGFELESGNFLISNINLPKDFMKKVRQIITN